MELIDNKFYYKYQQMLRKSKFGGTPWGAPHGTTIETNDLVTEADIR